ncbi:glycosyltransferase [bacterium]|nr:glycosyltransferase [bacterium]
MSKEHLVIFHINTEKGFRGGEMQTLHLVRGLQQRGHENCIFARPGSRILQEARASNIPCFTLPMRGEWDLISGRTLRRLVDVQKPDILHAHTAHACSIALMARWPDTLPSIVFSRRAAVPAKKTLLRRKLKHVDALLAVSQTVRNQLLEAGIPSQKIFVAESGSDFSQLDASPDRITSRSELGLPPDAFVIGNISFFDEEKGQEALIRAFCEFAKNQSRAYLLLVGEGPVKSRCEDLASQIGCGQRVLFTDYRSDVERIYPAMDLFFLSSSREGLSGVLREAMAVGIPVLAVRQPSTEEQVSSGILVSSEPAEWSEAIQKLFDDSDLRSDLAAKAKEQARKFTIDSMVEKTEDCYRKVLKL